jgi:DNA-binding Lrp family transcriptional regulator
MIGHLEPDARTREAIAELQATIIAAYPNATFEVVRAVDIPGNYDLLVTVEGADPDEVGDLVAERTLEMRVEESIPIHVVPLEWNAYLAQTEAGETRRAG